MGWRKEVLGTNGLKENMRHIQNYSYKHVMTSITTTRQRCKSTKAELSFFNTSASLFEVA